MRAIAEDAVERLRAANPVPVEAVPDPAGTPRGQALFRAIVARPARRALPVGRARLVAGLSALGLAGAGAGAAAYAISTRNVERTLNVACYEAPDLSARTVVVQPDRRTPEQACAALWRGGAFGSGPAPPLAVCALDSGVAAVFPRGPGGSPCERLHLPQADNSPAPPAAVQDARTAIVRRLLGRDCVSPEEAAATARRELDKRGLRDWAVHPAAPFSEDRPCAGVGVDEGERVIWLVPQPPVP